LRSDGSVQRFALATCRVERWCGSGFDDADVSIAPLNFRTAGFPQYGFKASLSDRAFRPSNPVKRVPRILRSAETFTLPFAHVPHRAIAWPCVQDKPVACVNRCTRGPASLPQGSLAPAGVVLSPALLD